MPFATEAQQLLGNLQPGTANHAILEYLINNASGAANAKSWDAIEAHCAGIPISVDKLDFQQGFLAESRDGGVFIGSCSKGYFIIQDRGDAIVAADFYRTRIDREQEHLTHLEGLVIQEGWPPI
jgi:hypothetical protein